MFSDSFLKNYKKNYYQPSISSDFYTSKNKEEIFIDLPNCENQYAIGNFGTVISKAVVRPMYNGGFHNRKEIVMKPVFVKGYKKIKIQGTIRKSMFVHHLVWICFGEGSIKFPDNVIDHIDKNKENNHIDNLRLVSTSVNNRNKKNNKEFIGVQEVSGVPIAVIKVNKKSYYLGAFKNKKEASETYNEAVKNYNKFEEWYSKLEIKRNKMNRVVLIFDKNDNLLYKCKNPTEAALKINSSKSNVSSALKGRIKYCKKIFKLVYEDET